MTEEEVKVVNWKKAAPMIVGLVIGLILVVLLLLPNNETQT